MYISSFFTIWILLPFGARSFVFSQTSLFVESGPSPEKLSFCPAERENDTMMIYSEIPIISGALYDDRGMNPVCMSLFGWPLSMFFVALLIHCDLDITRPNFSKKCSTTCNARTHPWGRDVRCLLFRDLISWWRHSIHKLSALLAICVGNPPYHQ